MVDLWLGTVTDFDDHRGLGTITSSDGTQYPFHCTQIADGSRTIDAGQPVTEKSLRGDFRDAGQPVRFALLPKLGRYEATAIEKV